MTPEQFISDNSIRLGNCGNGNHKTLCPKCSSGRKNKKDPCLSVTISNETILVNCHNCGWSGGSSAHQHRQEQAKPHNRKRASSSDWRRKFTSERKW